ncbi:MAG: hypothetical protein A2341_21250 [Deltaproteobacteria bacterium RIFOXYB12_FULL_58_9]|nr:MAG: hypothetical protein A2341_21250 [Deltaproteobacteria bacterium RIFOXYB12_FULL_58_9]
MLQRNKVFRSVESTAHGFLSPLRYEVVILAAVGLAGTFFHPLLGVALAVVCFVALTNGRRLDHGRREYLKLWMRRFEKQQYRLLDEDDQYVPYDRGGEQ